MDIQKYFLLFVFFFLIISFGYIVSRNVLKENKLISLIPLSVCIGSSVFVIMLHLIASITNPVVGTYITLAFLPTASLFISIKYKNYENIETGLPNIQFFYISLLSLFLGITSLAYLLFFDTYDPGLYQIIGTITKQGDYPPLNPANPALSLAYHNGVALYASALKIFLNAETWHSVIPIQAIFILIFPLIIFCLLYSITNSFLQSFLGALIGCFCANLTAFKLFSLFSNTSPSLFFSTIHEKIVSMNEGGFSISTSKALISPNMSVGLPLSVRLLFLSINKNILEKKYWLAMFFISAFLFFTYESFWIPVVVSSILYQAALIFQNKNWQAQVKTLVILTVILFISTLLVYGILTGTSDNMLNLLYFEPKSYTFSWSGILGQFYPSQWFTENSVISRVDGCVFYKVPFFSRCFFIEFGLPLILLPVTILWLLIKNKNAKLFFFLVGGISSFIIPFLMSYLPRQIELIRFFIYPRFTLSLIFGIFLGWLFNSKLPRIMSILWCGILSLLIVILILPGIVWNLPIRSEHDYRYNQFPYADKKALSWLNKNVKPGDRGIGPNGKAYKHYELINIAGVYGVAAHYLILLEQETKNTVFTTLNPCLLKKLNVKWIYFNQDLLSKAPQKRLKELLQEKILVLRYKYKSNNEVRTIFEFKPKNIEKYCKEKEYAYVIGRIQNGDFIPLTKDPKYKTSRMIFSTKKAALNKLNKLKESLDKKEAFWYRVEVIKI